MQATEKGDAVVVTVDPDNCAALWKTVEPWVAQGKKRVVLDFGHVSFINSLNIAQIVALRHRCGPSGTEIRVAGLKENIKAVFRILRLDKLFPLDLDLAGALA
ncbi:MAG: STAS domain-containing protein [Planctomycetes bacterium]|nr:STAS domain-containing protein [Planctomycetota bacterium]